MEDYEEFGLGVEEEEGGKREGGFVFWFFGFVKWVGILGGKIPPGRCHANIYIWMVGMLSSVLHYTLCTHVLTNELGEEAFSTD